jgi:hypothetical protein
MLNDGSPPPTRRAPRPVGGSAPPRLTGTRPSRATQAEQAVRLALQDAARDQAAAAAAQTETARVRADADKMLATFRTDATRDRDELRADLRARAERADPLADAYRDELTQLRVEISHPVGTAIASKTPRRTVHGSQP